MMWFLFVYFLMLSHSSNTHNKMHRFNCLAPVYYKTLSDNIRMAFLHRTPISWTLSLHKPFEGQTLTEGKFIWLRKDSEGTSDRPRVAWCSMVFIQSAKSFSQEPTNPKQLPNRGCCIPWTMFCFDLNRSHVKEQVSYPTSLYCFCRNVSPSDWRAENQYLQPSPEKKEAWFTDLPTRWGATI